LLPPACCSCLDGTSFSSSKSPLPLLLEAMVLLNRKQILAETAWNKTRRENDIRTSRGPGDYIAKIFTTNGKYQIEPESERGDGAAKP
jgi:hypothetical protein